MSLASIRRETAFMSVNITFLGGADTVTGSKYLVSARRAPVACWWTAACSRATSSCACATGAPLPVAPDQIGAVVLTHAHLDHSGYLPLLVKEGFTGKVYATPGTRDLCKHPAARQRLTCRKKMRCLRTATVSPSTHRPAACTPVRTREKPQADQGGASRSASSFQPLPGWFASFTSAGHILGAASVLLEVAGHRILFSGDLGRDDDLIMNPPDRPPVADTVLIESTYGDREHPAENIAGRTGAPAAPRLPLAAVWPWCRCLPWGGRRPCCMRSTCSRRRRSKFPRPSRCSWTARWPCKTTHLFERPPGRAPADGANAGCRSDPLRDHGQRDRRSPRRWRAAAGRW
jgi:metallo-beta-lactamase family protein